MNKLAFFQVSINSIYDDSSLILDQRHLSKMKSGKTKSFSKGESRNFIRKTYNEAKRQGKNTQNNSSSKTLIYNLLTKLERSMTILPSPFTSSGQCSPQQKVISTKNIWIEMEFNHQTGKSQGKTWNKLMPMTINRTLRSWTSSTARERRIPMPQMIIFNASKTWSKTKFLTALKNNGNG